MALTIRDAMAMVPRMPKPRCQLQPVDVTPTSKAVTMYFAEMTDESVAEYVRAAVEERNQRLASAKRISLPKLAAKLAPG